jgi:formylglycine-generating enzyme required for sulfatase activity
VGGEAGVAEPAGPQNAGGAVMARAAAAFVADSPFADGLAPAWANEWGEDRFGAFAAFEVAGVAQVMRWIPPGSYRMGSPPGEPGRHDNEGPQHRVTLTTGFWLAETPCTEALWTAVMGDNPSRFRSAERPVKRVSWDDVQGFLARIETLAPGLGLGLPTEAQWEYACRAGTTSALYTGPIEIVGQNNAPALDPIAWYCGNTGFEFKVYDVGREEFSVFGFESEEEMSKAGTQPVKCKAPNAWGLFDMLGNVWECCADGFKPYRRHGVTDPVVPDMSGAGRVFRGGSWSDTAWYCRSACRLKGRPDGRYGNVGFRCARVQG